MTSSSKRRVPRRLLAIDGDGTTPALLSDFLAPHGWVVQAAPSAEDGLRLLQGAPPDAIVSEVVLPGADGWDLLEEVRSRPDLGHAPFVFLTTEGELPARLRAFHAGADDYVTKPFSVEEVHARVERLVTLRSGTIGGDSPEPALLAGAVAHFALSDLLQVLALNAIRAAVHLREDGREGMLTLRDGRILHAECEGVTGRKAVARLLGWTYAEFRVVPLGDRWQRTLDAPATEVVMDCLVALDEWNRWKGALPPETARIVLGDPGGGAGHAVSGEEEILSRVREGTTLRRLLDEIPLTDGDLAEALCSLLSRKAVIIEDSE